MYPKQTNKQKTMTVNFRALTYGQGDGSSNSDNAKLLTKQFYKSYCDLRHM